MGSTLIFNDTLSLTHEQGFPKNLLIEQHLINPYTTDQFKDIIFHFEKSDYRFYHPQPNPVYLVQNIKGKWIYCGMVRMQKVTHDFTQNKTIGEYKIVDIFDYNRMKECFAIRDKRLEFDYFR